MDGKMTTIIDILREEHRNIEKMLLVLERELDVFDRREQPDYEVLHAVISYFQGYPEHCHHPKEDMVFEKLKVRDPVAAESVGNLVAEHQEESNRLQRLAQAIENILAGREVLRTSFDTIARDFIEHERQHIDMEERALFPAAIKALRPEDWAGIDARLTDKQDPLANEIIEEKFRFLHQRILQWEAQDEAERA
jgi:hemerythrin-like domain-containing protein